jgi:hypothetical protein
MYTKYLNLRERKKWHVEEIYTKRNFVIGILYQITLMSENLMQRDNLINLVVDGRRILQVLLTSSVLICGSDSSGQGREMWKRLLNIFLHIIH